MRSARPSTAGPGDPARGDYGSIPDPAQSYLPAHPDSFAELSVLDSNPANGGSFTFADANALGSLPYMTGAAGRARRRTRAAAQARHRLRAGPRPVDRKRAALPAGRVVAGRPDARRQQERGEGRSSHPPTGAARRSKRSRSPAEASGGGEASAACPAGEGAGNIPLPLTPGTADEDPAERAGRRRRRSARGGKAMVAAGNRLFGTAYLYGGAHGTPLSTLRAGV